MISDDRRGKRVRACSLAIAVLVSIPSVEANDVPKAGASSVPTIQVTGQSSYSSVGANGYIEAINSADLMKFGQVTLGEALSRYGSIVVISGRNGNQEISLSGLGNGYTQILINGSPTPRGFSLDSLPADAIERVEIIRSSSSDIGARGIVGTLNIILKRANANNAARSFKATATEGWIRGHMLDVSYSISIGDANFLVQSSDRRTHVDREVVRQQFAAHNGEATSSSEYSFGPATVHERVLAPKFEWKRAGRTLGLDLTTQTSRQARFSRYEKVAPLATPAKDLGETVATIKRDFHSAAFAYRDDAVAEGTSLDLKVLASNSERVSSGDYIYKITSESNANRKVSYPSDDDAVTASAKLHHTFVNEGEAEVGAQFSRASRNESEYNSTLSLAPRNYQLQIRNAAFYGRWLGRFNGANAQVGLRYERISLSYEQAAESAPSRGFPFFAPHLSWSRSLAGNGPTVSAALTRSLRVPDEADFSARTYYSLLNALSSPDQRGNPALRPEIATSLELAAASSKRSPTNLRAALTYKLLGHVIADELFMEGASWVVRPINVGSGRLLLGDFSFRARLPPESRESYDFGFGGALNFAWSQVALPSGRSTRLPNSAPYQLTLNADVRKRGDRPWAAGYNFIYRAAQQHQDIGGIIVQQSPRRLLDLYYSLQLAASLTGRASVTNALQRNVSRTVYQQSSSRSNVDVARTADGPTFRITLEWAIP